MKNAGKACNNRLYRHIRTFEKIVKNYFVIYKEICDKNMNTLQDEIHFLPFWDNGVRFFTIKGPNEEKIEFSQFL